MNYLGAALFFSASLYAFPIQAQSWLNRPASLLGIGETHLHTSSQSLGAGRAGDLLHDRFAGNAHIPSLLPVNTSYLLEYNSSVSGTPPAAALDASDQSAWYAKRKERAPWSGQVVVPIKAGLTAGYRVHTPIYQSSRVQVANTDGSRIQQFSEWGYLREQSFVVGWMSPGLGKSPFSLRSRNRSPIADTRLGFGLGLGWRHGRWLDHHVASYDSIYFVSQRREDILLPSLTAQGSVALFSTLGGAVLQVQYLAAKPNGFSSRFEERVTLVDTVRRQFSELLFTYPNQQQTFPVQWKIEGGGWYNSQPKGVQGTVFQIAVWGTLWDTEGALPYTEYERMRMRVLQGQLAAQYGSEVLALKAGLSWQSTQFDWPESAPSEGLPWTNQQQVAFSLGVSVLPLQKYITHQFTTVPNHHSETSEAERVAWQRKRRVALALPIIKLSAGLQVNSPLLEISGSRFVPVYVHGGIALSSPWQVRRSREVLAPNE